MIGVCAALGERLISEPRQRIGRGGERLHPSPLGLQLVEKPSGELVLFLRRQAFGGLECPGEKLSHAVGPAFVSYTNPCADCILSAMSEVAFISISCYYLL
jgi:hypothetical protein